MLNSHIVRGVISILISTRREEGRLKSISHLRRVGLAFRAVAQRVTERTGRRARIGGHRPGELDGVRRERAPAQRLGWRGQVCVAGHTRDT